MDFRKKRLAMIDVIKRMYAEKAFFVTNFLRAKVSWSINKCHPPMLKIRLQIAKKSIARVSLNMPVENA